MKKMDTSFMTMNQRKWLTGLCLFLGIALPGCGPNDPVIETPDNQQFTAVNSSVPELKKRLEELAVTGAYGSALEGLSESIEKLVEDPATKKSLLQDAATLNAAQSEEQVKPIAKRMAEKL
jgi:hypothetical protein